MRSWLTSRHASLWSAAGASLLVAATLGGSVWVGGDAIRSPGRALSAGLVWLSAPTLDGQGRSVSVVDAVGGREISRIAVDDSTPWKLVPGDRDAYVVYPEEGRVDQIDSRMLGEPSTLSRSGTADPSIEVMATQGKVFVSRPSLGSIEIHTEGGRDAGRSVVVPGLAAMTLAAPDRMWVLGSEGVGWITAAGGYQAGRLPALPAGGRLVTVGPDGARIPVVVEPGGAALSVVDPTSLATDVRREVSRLGEMVIGTSNGWVVGFDRDVNVVHAVEVGTGVERSLQLPTSTTDLGEPVTVDGLVYVPDRGAGQSRVWVLDPESESDPAAVTVEADALSLSVQSGRVWFQPAVGSAGVAGWIDDDGTARSIELLGGAAENLRCVVTSQRTPPRTADPLVLSAQRADGRPTVDVTWSFDEAVVQGETGLTTRSNTPTVAFPTPGTKRFSLTADDLQTTCSLRIEPNELPPPDTAATTTTTPPGVVPVTLPPTTVAEETSDTKAKPSGGAEETTTSTTTTTTTTTTEPPAGAVTWSWVTRPPARVNVKETFSFVVRSSRRTTIPTDAPAGSSVSCPGSASSSADSSGTQWTVTVRVSASDGKGSCVVSVDGDSSTVAVFSTVPDTDGMTLPAAESAIKGAGCPLNVPSSMQESSPTVAAGSVIRTDPPKGSECSHDSHVVIVISAGRGDIPIPPVSGAEAAALKTLSDAKLTNVAVQREYSADVDAGSAIRTEPAVGTAVAPSAPVLLYISLGPRPRATIECSPTATATYRQDPADPASATFSVVVVTASGSCSVNVSNGTATGWSWSATAGSTGPQGFPSVFTLSGSGSSPTFSPGSGGGHPVQVNINCTVTLSDGTTIAAPLKNVWWSGCD